MMRCPYCRTPLDSKKIPDFAKLSPRRRRILKAVIKAGIDGLPYTILKERFLDGKSDITVRTTINAINRQIRPMMVISRGKVLRLASQDD